MTDVDTQMHPSFFYNYKETVMLIFQHGQKSFQPLNKNSWKTLLFLVLFSKEYNRISAKVFNFAIINRMLISYT